MRFMKRKRKENREKRKKLIVCHKNPKKMKKVYAQDKKVVKEKIQGKKAKENSLQVSVTRSASYAWNHIPRVPQEKSGGGVLYANLGLTSVV